MNKELIYVWNSRHSQDGFSPSCGLSATFPSVSFSLILSFLSLISLAEDRMPSQPFAALRWPPPASLPTSLSLPLFLVSVLVWDRYGLVREYTDSYRWPIGTGSGSKSANLRWNGLIPIHGVVSHLGGPWDVLL